MLILNNFLKKITIIDKCWVWNAVKTNGYGIFCIDRKAFKAHKISYELFYGKIPNGLEIDHLCKNKSCVNPIHLEAVTHKENIKRGNAGIYNKIKIYCKKGHSLLDNNLYIRKNGNRMCKTCNKNYYKKGEMLVAV